VPASSSTDASIAARAAPPARSGSSPSAADPFAAAAPPETRALRGDALEPRPRRRRGAARQHDADPCRAPFDVQALFAAAGAGDAVGRAVAERAARDVAVCVAAISAVVDLELVLLGGGIGASDELLFTDVRRAVASLVPSPPRIERASLGDRAVVTGAVAVAHDGARQALVRRLVPADR